MKKRIISCMLVTVFLSLMSCENHTPQHSDEHKAVIKEQYRCPMKCTEELFDKPGKCPVCGMELEKITSG